MKVDDAAVIDSTLLADPSSSMRCPCKAIISSTVSKALCEETACAEFGRAVAALPPCPSFLDGRGIVIPGGGRRYFSSAWVCINILRDLGCTLPIELWHLGEAEIDSEMRALVEPLGVRCIDALHPEMHCRMRKLGGWELKAFAMVHSNFREMIFLDADNVPVVDPTFLFESPEYQRRGSIYWPDGQRFPVDDPIWKLTGVAYRDEQEFESGQAVIDKERCWRPLLLALWMNNHSDFWYRHIYGDKDTFHLAWRKLGLEYSMPPHPLRGLSCAMVQHDFQGRPLFQHRHADKFDVSHPSQRDDAFVHEHACVEHLRRLRRLWTARVDAPFNASRANKETIDVAKELTLSFWKCQLLDGLPNEFRAVWDKIDITLEFRSDGTIDSGGVGALEFWNLQVRAGTSILVLSGDEGVVMRVLADGPRRWLGRLNCSEPIRVELIASQDYSVE
jgi:hypothetical protein